MDDNNTLVNLSSPYQVIINKNILFKTGKIIQEKIGCNKALVLSDTNVAPLYLDIICNSIKKCGIYTDSYTIIAGEMSKTPQTMLEIISYLAQHEYNRNDVVIALGGGVVGDIGGLVSALYKRGMKLVQIPTSLLAMVDSSVGGKTAVDLPEGKNLMGAFKHPSVVICDPIVLKTLPKREFSCGMAEVIKYAMIKDSKLFNTLMEEDISSKHINDTLTNIIKTCISIKADIVVRDEFDNGERKLLNFGHTIGHAVESQSNYSLSHGESIAIGMAYITLYAEKCKICTKESYIKLITLLKKYSLPYTTNIKKDLLFDFIMKDKKRVGDNISIVLPKSIGKSIIADYAISEIMCILRTGGGDINEC